MKRLLLSTVTLLTISAMAHAQTNTGTITGQVLDAQAALVAGATVRVTNIATGVMQEEVVTGKAGVYTVPSLQPGQYRVAVEAPGFSTTVVEPLPGATGPSLTSDVTPPTAG